MDMGSVDGVLSIKDDCTATLRRAADQITSVQEKFQSASDSVVASVGRQSGAMSDAAIAQQKAIDATLANVEAVTKAYDAYQKLVAQLDPVEAATQQYGAAVVTLENALNAGLITQQRYDEQL